MIEPRLATDPSWIRFLYDANNSLQQRNSVPFGIPPINHRIKLYFPISKRTKSKMDMGATEYLFLRRGNLLGENERFEHVVKLTFILGNSLNKLGEWM